MTILWQNDDVNLFGLGTCFLLFLTSMGKSRNEVLFCFERDSYA